MRKSMTGLAAVVVVAVLAVGATAVTAQSRRQREVPPPAMLFGPGSAIGASVRDLSPAEASKANVSSGGALIEDVEQRSPAEKAGLKGGDVVVEFDGERVRSARQFARLVGETAEGRSVKAVIVRGGSRQTVDLAPEASRHPFADMIGPNVEREIRRRMRTLPRDLEFDVDLGGPRMGIAVAPRGRLGVSVTPLTDQLASYFGAKNGVLVSSVTSDSPAGKAGVKAGDVILSINSRPIDDPDDLIEEVARLKAGESVEIGILRDKTTSTLKATLPRPKSFLSAPVRSRGLTIRPAALARTTLTLAA